jgi:hypothetical protein
MTSKAKSELQQLAKTLGESPSTESKLASSVILGVLALEDLELNRLQLAELEPVDRTMPMYAVKGDTP